MSFKVPDQYRVTKGPHGSHDLSGNNGMFMVPCKASKDKKLILRVIASDGEGWEHVSVSPANAQRTPTWEEMSFVKNLFWDSEDCVVEYHPPKASYVNNHPHVLHLWKSTDVIIPTPKEYLVGMRGPQDVDAIIYEQLGMLGPVEQEEKMRIANNMMLHGGSFVKVLGDLLQRADPNNTRKIKQMFPEYWEQYSADWEGKDEVS